MNVTAPVPSTGCHSTAATGFSKESRMSNPPDPSPAAGTLRSSDTVKAAAGMLLTARARMNSVGPWAVRARDGAGFPTDVVRVAVAAASELLVTAQLVLGKDPLKSSRRT